MDRDAIRSPPKRLFDRPDQNLVVKGRTQLTAGGKMHEDPRQSSPHPFQEPQHPFVQDQSVGTLQDPHPNGTFRVFQARNRAQADAMIERQDHHPTVG